MRNINITAAQTTKSFTRKIEISFIRRKTGLGFPLISVYFPAKVDGLAPALWRTKRYINIETTPTVFTIACGKYKPFAILRDHLCAFILIGIYIAAKWCSFYPIFTIPL